MSLRVSGKNMNIGEALRVHVQGKVAAAVGKYFDGEPSGHVTIAPEGSGFRADCTLHLKNGVTVQADGRAQEPYACFDQAAERIEKRLRRYKSRIKERKHEKADAGGVMVASYVLEAPDEETDAPAEQDFAPTVIAETSTRLGAMTIAAAVMELDMTGVTVLPFRHAATGRVNVIYRRSDGNIGWLDPAGEDKAKA
ncbi:MAG: ribosome-associated translation inhibitor RaiA [Hyphomicrobiales bacterium]|nr:ribosome-associated translation inhibitor RaiA [Rhodoblastus sp.]MCB9998115.1 ribosome-associated translation inhibitor RaiA [Methylobacteriaceae bacterium]MCC2105193.1 ribosome-associated translation inhibitor RaiA [Hyphomicrobiales bacterium]HRY02861.1 ribosome-associated translation inhibitor RaiA [Beijerinckiaceae bacterium]MCB1525042.1 ribosome-associated translation inhibitor RaiA [Rhodoblastus sp.]